MGSDLTGGGGNNGTMPTGPLAALSTLKSNGVNKTLQETGGDVTKKGKEKEERSGAQIIQSVKHLLGGGPK